MIKFAVVAVAIYVALLVGAYAFHNWLILPGRHDTSAATPAAVGLTFDDLELPVEAGTHLRAWWIPATRSSRTVVLYFHGNYETLETEAAVEAPLWHRTGANVLLVEYRGYGGSSRLQASGPTTEADARAALRYLTEQRHVAVSDIVLAGRSIGAGVAAELALETPGAAGLVLITPITNVADVANQNWLFRYLLRPIEWFVRADNFDTEKRIVSVRMPLLIVAGGRDMLAPPWMAQRILARANEPKSLVIIEAATHNDIFERPDPRLRQALAGAVARSANPEPEHPG